MRTLSIKPAARNAIVIGGLCSVSYLGVYIARNLLSSTSTQISELGVFSTAQLGTLSSIYFIVYAIGQLINGWIGDRIKAKYMISFGLIFAGLCNMLFSLCAGIPLAAYICYGACGFFLSMIYGPMTKVVSENTEPIYATRCSLGYTFASFIGSPAAGVIAMLAIWYIAFRITAVCLMTMGFIAFLAFTHLEKKGVISSTTKFRAPTKGGKLKTLIKRGIIKFTVISIVTGVVRTTVVFWLPTYLAQHLGFSSHNATMIYTVATLIISFTAFVSVFIYELLRRNMDLAILLYFISACLFFTLVLLVRQPVANIVFLILSIMSSNASASMMWSRYCPSLYDTGMVSTATGYLDFISYMAASASSTIFANAVPAIGWSGLILVWIGLMVVGIVVSLPYKKNTAA